MTRRGAIRRMFPGSNSSRGFVSFFEYIPADSSCYTFVLKGGPGTGKSTFMQRIAADLLSLGVDTEFHHCSADAQSVDGVSFPSLRVAIVDGTAPHAVEPIDYEVSGEIVDLGTFCDRAAIRRQRSRIERLRTDGRDAFARAYRYLAAARTIRDDWAAANMTRSGGGLLSGETGRVLDAIFRVEPTPARSNRLPVGARRRLFASSITPDGPRSHLDELVRPLQRIFIVTGAPGTGRSQLMHAVAEEAGNRGYPVELFHCAFDPDDIDHVLIPALRVGVVSSAPPHEYAPRQGTTSSGSGVGLQFIDLNESLGLSSPLRSPADMHTHRDDRDAPKASHMFWQLFQHAVKALAQAKGAHMQLEACYVPHTDFTGLEQLRERIRDRIIGNGEGAGEFPAPTVGIASDFL